MSKWIRRSRWLDATGDLYRRLRRGIGVLVEAILWSLGFLLAQGMVLIGLLAVLMIATFGFHWPSQDELLKWILEIELDRSFLLVATPVLGMLFLIIPAIRWREGREFRNRIGWRSPTSEEIVFSLATVVPMALIGNLVYDVMNQWWHHEPIVWPFALALREGSLDQLYRTFQGVPYPVLVVALALTPAIVEELVFRGVLGRRLVQQFGAVWGVLLASSCFALVHGSLPHAVATFPVAVLLHVLYLQTGTIWIPVLVHFCNNLLAISMVRFDLGPESSISPLFMVALCGYLGLMLFLLQTRHRRWEPSTFQNSQHASM